MLLTVTALTVLSHTLCLPHPTQAVRLQWAGPYVHSSPHLSQHPSPGCLHGRWPPHPTWAPTWWQIFLLYRCPSHSTQALTAQVELLTCLGALFIPRELILHIRHTHTLDLISHAKPPTLRMLSSCWHHHHHPLPPIKLSPLWAPTSHTPSDNPHVFLPLRTPFIFSNPTSGFWPPMDTPHPTGT